MDTAVLNPITGQSDIKIGELIVCYPNKYTIISINSIVSIQGTICETFYRMWIGQGIPTTVGNCRFVQQTLTFIVQLFSGFESVIYALCQESAHSDP